jgi:DNA-binding GntR family transcriptional regulator
MIVSSELLPGTPLQEVELSERLEVSRTPLREALRTLESEGLVEIQPRHGARVAQLSRHDIANAYEARGWVEPPAVRKATQLIDSETLVELEATVESFPEEPQTHEEASAALKLDLRFHELIIQVIDNRLITNLINEARTITTRAAYFVPPGRYYRSREEHRAILNALAQGNGELAEEHMRTHLREARNRMLGKH